MHQVDELNFEDKEYHCLGILLKHNVKYLLVGGHAVNYHGYNRETKDVDILTNNDSETANNLSAAIHEIIGPHPNVTPNAIVGRKRQINLTEHGFNFEIITSIDGLNFVEAYERANHIIIRNLKLSIISKEDLIYSKQVSGREVDVQDIENLDAV